MSSKKATLKKMIELAKQMQGGVFTAREMYDALVMSGAARWVSNTNSVSAMLRKSPSFESIQDNKSRYSYRYVENNVS